MPDRYDRLAEILRLRDELDEQGQSAAGDAAHAFAIEMISIRQGGTQRRANADQRAAGAPTPPATAPTPQPEPEDEIPF